MKNLSVLGSTGSIGTQTLDIVRKHKDEFNVIALSCGHNISLFKEQLKEFAPRFAVCAEKSDMEELGKAFPGIEFSFGLDGICTAASLEGADMVVNSLLGMMGIKPTYEAICAGKNIAFANKETLVAGGDFIMDAVKKKGIAFLPVDSEHSAIFQCLQGAGCNKLKKILLTASGGPFRGYTAEQLKSVTKEQALKHPNWSMGAKITIDSATMMNKGLEIIEACRLFDVSAKAIEVVVHPESAIHSAIEFEDGSIIAQIGRPDMRIPIAYALSYPKRLSNVGESLDLFKLSAMHFEKPDTEVFKCLSLAMKAIEYGGSYTIVLNAANEEAVAAFLNDKINFVQIGDAVEEALQRHVIKEISSVDDILEVEKTARNAVLEYIGGISK